MTNDLKEFLESEGYYAIREIDGKVCGLHNYMYTCGLVVGLTRIGYDRRYCYPSVMSAAVALENYTDTSKHATGPWIKCKGRFEGKPIDMLNPEL